MSARYLRRWRLWWRSSRRLRCTKLFLLCRIGVMRVYQDLSTRASFLGSRSALRSCSALIVFRLCLAGLDCRDTACAEPDALRKHLIQGLASAHPVCESPPWRSRCEHASVRAYHHFPPAAKTLSLPSTPLCRHARMCSSSEDLLRRGVRRLNLASRTPLQSSAL